MKEKRGIGIHRARSRPSLRGLDALSLRMSSSLRLYVCLPKSIRLPVVCVCAEKRSEDAASHPARRLREKREKRKRRRSCSPPTDGVVAIARNRIKSPPNSKSNNDVVELEKDFKRERRQRNTEEYIEGMQCCHQKSIQDRQGCASTSFAIFHFK